MKCAVTSLPLLDISPIPHSIHNVNIKFALNRFLVYNSVVLFSQSYIIYIFMTQRETVAEILLRTCDRYIKIKHLPLEQKKHLMSLTEEDFKLEFKNIRLRNAI
jgi:hypothetical protein